MFGYILKPELTEFLPNIICFELSLPILKLRCCEKQFYQKLFVEKGNSNDGEPHIDK
jgi:hypothetical protein